MSDALGVDISGLQEIQRRNLRLLAALRTGTIEGEAVKGAAAVAHREEVARTHVITGTLRASHRVYMETPHRAVRAIITPDPSARNPLTGERPAVYGLFEELRGGSHAFAHRAITEGWPAIRAAAGDSAIAAIRSTR